MISSNLGGNSGLSRNGRKGGRLRIASKIIAEVSPRNGIAPVAISYNTAPNEKRSVRTSSCFPLACSGDMYATVPSAAPGPVSCSPLDPAVASNRTPAACATLLLIGVSLASPKSNILACPLLVTKILAGLMSR